MHPPARYLILIESGEGMIARLFDARRMPLGEFDASSFEVAEMTSRSVPTQGAELGLWGHALEGHSAQQCAEARIYTLDP